MTGERKLDRRREDPDPDVGIVGGRREDENGLGEVRLAGDRLHVDLAQVAAVREDGDRVAGQRLVGEDVGDDVAKAAHGSRLPVGPCLTGSPGACYVGATAGGPVSAAGRSTVRIGPVNQCRAERSHQMPTSRIVLPTSTGAYWM